MKTEIITKKTRFLLPVLALVSLTFATAFLFPSQSIREGNRSNGNIDPTTPPGNTMHEEDLEIFLDSFMPAQLKEKHIPGAAVAVVKDGRLVLSKGYGYANIAEGEYVDPEKTLFRIGSVSKLFVWTSVMQLYEQGKIDLDADVNQYLPGFQIPATFPEPITMRHLMTHTAGFEDGVMGMVREDVLNLEPSGDFLGRRMPARVFRPGEISGYSNYGNALAAYNVESVSGLRFEDYVESHIFDPLQMNQTTFRQPVPSSLSSQLAAGYRFDGKQIQEKPFESSRSHQLVAQARPPMIWRISW